MMNFRLSLVLNLLLSISLGITAAGFRQGDTTVYIPVVSKQASILTATAPPTPTATLTSTPSPTPTATPTAPPSSNHREKMAFVDNEGAWVINLDGSAKTLLTAEASSWGPVLASPSGNKIAIWMGSNWSIFDLDGNVLAEGIGKWHELCWNQDGSAVLLADDRDGIDEFKIDSGQTRQIIDTTGFTYDHSPIWTTDGQTLIFAHHEFGTQLYVTKVSNFSFDKIPYQGENRYEGVLNPLFTLLLEVQSWQDQSIRFHLTQDEQTLIFAAGTAIYSVDIASGTMVKIEPPGFGQSRYARDVDLSIHDQILYFADGGLYLMDRNGQNSRKLVNGSDLRYPQWSPAGDRLAFIASNEIRIVNRANSSEDQMLPNTSGAKHFDWFVVP